MGGMPLLENEREGLGACLGFGGSGKNKSFNIGDSLEAQIIIIKKNLFKKNNICYRSKLGCQLICMDESTVDHVKYMLCQDMFNLNTNCD